MRIHPRNATVYGIDLGKSTFHVVGVNPAGEVVQKCKLSRTTIFPSPIPKQTRAHADHAQSVAFC